MVFPRALFLAPYCLCYINDLPNNIKSKIRIYADDTLVYSCINTVEDCIILSEKASRVGEMGQNMANGIQPTKM